MQRRSSSRAAQGSGTIRKKTVEKNGRKYEYWEARLTVGRDPGTGRQIQRSFTGKTQKEVRQKLQAAAVALDAGEYVEPSKLTVGQWLDIWTKEYLHSVKPRTADSYRSAVEQHIKPGLGAVRLVSLSSIDVQRFYNGLRNTRTGEELSAKTKMNIHGAFHKALEKAVSLGYIRHNPADRPDLPKVVRPEICPLDSEQIKRFLLEIRGSEYEALFSVTLFTGMREGEIMGLCWDCVDFDAGVITIRRQLQYIRGSGGLYDLVSTKNGKPRQITPAAFVMDLLRERRTQQLGDQEKAGELWSNPYDLVFTTATGGHLITYTVYSRFKQIVQRIGLPDARFHDLRHSYAVASLVAGDDIKTVQENLGHATAAFTLDVYAHVTAQMRQASAARMDSFIASLDLDAGKPGTASEAAPSVMVPAP